MSVSESWLPFWYHQSKVVWSLKLFNIYLTTRKEETTSKSSKVASISFLEYASEFQGGERAVHPAAAINFQFSSEARLINIDSMITIRQKGDENESK
jgi:hypothetical protein